MLAHHRANIVETSYDRAYHGANLCDAVIEITLEARGPDRIEEILTALRTGNYTHELV